VADARAQGAAGNHPTTSTLLARQKRSPKKPLDRFAMLWAHACRRADQHDLSPPWRVEVALLSWWNDGR